MAFELGVDRSGKAVPSKSLRPPDVDRNVLYMKYSEFVVDPGEKEVATT